jgi:hypothetical protein
MTSLDRSKQSTAAHSSPRAALAQPNDQAAHQRFEASARRDASAELGYGCVDWFIYSADARIACGPAPVTG